MIERLKNFFEIDAKNSSVQTEVLAGLSTFLSLSYIFVVNPAILSQAGMDKNSVLFATIITSGLATLIMGLWARLPFVLAPGMEMNAYVAFFVVGALGFSWQQALGAVFWSGVIFVVLTITRIREKIIESIPERMKSGLSLCVGVFLWLVALRITGILVYQDVAIKSFGSFTSPLAIVFYFSLLVLLALEKLKVRGAVLISITLTTLLGHLLGIVDYSEQTAEASKTMLAGIGQLDITVIANPKIISVILILFLIDFYGSVAKLIGLTLNTNILEHGKLPRAKEALMIDGAGTLIGSSLGTTNITVYVESGVGIGAGGRTGLTATTCGVLMLACFFIAPVLKYIPVVAATGALASVGIKLIPKMRQLMQYSKTEKAILVTMQIVVILTFAIDRAMLTGFLAYLISDVARQRRLNPYLVGSTLVLVVGAILQKG